MDFSKANLKYLDQFFTKNKDVDFRTINLLDESVLATLSFDRLKKHKDDILLQLKGWQRLLKIMPEAESEATIIKGLLGKNLHSAVQIASIPKKQFFQKASELFESKEQMEAFYRNASGIRTQLALKYMKLKQNAEPHINATRFHGKS